MKMGMSKKTTSAPAPKAKTMTAYTGNVVSKGMMTKAKPKMGKCGMCK